VTPSTELLDVGAGTGRFALALAPLVARVTAVEPSDAMLKYLNLEATMRRLTNVFSLPMSWEEAPANLQADVVICSHVLYPIWDIDLFLKKLYAATRHSCYIYMRATHLDALTAPLWRHFHGDERLLSPCYIHALDVLFELGLYADVEMVRTSSSLHFSSLDMAVEEMLEMLILPDTPQIRRELSQLLEQWLIPHGNELIPPQSELVSAILKLVRPTGAIES